MAEKKTPVTDAPDVTDHQETVLDMLANTNRYLRSMETDLHHQMEDLYALVFVGIVLIVFLVTLKRP